MSEENLPNEVSSALNDAVILEDTVQEPDESQVEVFLYIFFLLNNIKVHT